MTNVFKLLPILNFDVARFSCSMMYTSILASCALACMCVCQCRACVFAHTFHHSVCIFACASHRPYVIRSQRRAFAHIRVSVTCVRLRKRVSSLNVRLRMCVSSLSVVSLSLCAHIACTYVLLFTRFVVQHASLHAGFIVRCVFACESYRSVYVYIVIAVRASLHARLIVERTSSKARL